MKVGIVTIVSLNFGNRLQNYALQRVLESLGCTVYTFRRTQLFKGIKYYTKVVVQTLLQTKGAKFRKFDKNICFSDIVLGRDKFPGNIAQKYDYFIAGSDQIWNPYYNFVAGKCDFLEFAHNRQKISYAASFGVEEVPIEKRVEFKRALETFKTLSVREIQGVNIIHELTGRQAKLVLDPTLLLSNKEWQMIEKKSRFRPNGEYILVYMLGSKHERYYKMIDNAEVKCQILDVRLKQKNGKELPIGPAEFIYLIRNAEAVVTDSFHATVFSIIFHKKFVAFNRSGLNMRSRIESLARILEMDSYLNQQGDLECMSQIDYDHIDSLLAREKQKSIDFLKQALM